MNLFLDLKKRILSSLDGDLKEGFFKDLRRDIKVETGKNIKAIARSILALVAIFFISILLLVVLRGAIRTAIVTKRMKKEK